MADRNRKGRASGGGWRAKHSPDRIRTIRHLLAEGLPMTLIAKAFGVAPNSIAQIKRGTSYRKVQ